MNRAEFDAATQTLKDADDQIKAYTNKLREINEVMDGQRVERTKIKLASAELERSVRPLREAHSLFLHKLRAEESKARAENAKAQSKKISAKDREKLRQSLTAQLAALDADDKAKG